MASTASNGVKLEDNSTLHPETEVTTPSAFGDDDYEDTGELQFQKDYLKWWLIRVPKDLWSFLDKFKDDDEITLGSIKIWDTTDQKTGQPKTNPKMRFTLAPEVDVVKKMDKQTELSYIPKEYDLTMQNMQVTNKFVFFEKNLPGYRPSTLGRRGDKQGQDTRKGPEDKVAGSRVEKPWRRFNRTIPKHTSYCGAPDHELHCNPIENAEWREITARKQREREQSASFVTHAGHQLALHNASLGIGDREMLGKGDFIKVGGLEKKRPQDAKAARLEREELTDLLAKKFREYKYWRIGSLKEAINQPEAWLREVLGQIAMLVKTGPAANTWTLRPEWAAAVDMKEEDFGDVKQEEIAPGDEDSEMGDDEFDDGEEMVDVV